MRKKQRNLKVVKTCLCVLCLRAIRPQTQKGTNVTSVNKKRHFLLESLSLSLYCAKRARFYLLFTQRLYYRYYIKFSQLKILLNLLKSPRYAAPNLWEYNVWKLNFDFFQCFNVKDKEFGFNRANRPDRIVVCPLTKRRTFVSIIQCCHLQSSETWLYSMSHRDGANIGCFSSK